MNTNEQTKKRDVLYFDFLKILAIWMVLFNHTGQKGYMLFSVAEKSPLFLFYLFISIIDKIAVPLFFMISGALLLNRDESLKDLYKKRILKYFLILVVFSFIYYLYDCYFQKNIFSLSEFFKKFYTSKLSGQFWYLYTYLGILIMLPILRKLSKALTEKEYYYWIILYVIMVGIIPVLQFWLSKGEWSINNTFLLPLFVPSNMLKNNFTSGGLFFFMTGYYFECIRDKNKNTKSFFIYLTAASILSVLLSCFITMYYNHVTGEWGQIFHNSFICIPTFTVFLFVQKYFEKHPVGEDVTKWIRALGKYSFGVFLIERMLRERTEFIYEFLFPYLRSLPSCIIWITIDVILGYLIVSFFYLLFGKKAVL